jgi:hypothetical protein
LSVVGLILPEQHELALPPSGVAPFGKHAAHVWPAAVLQ